MKLKLFLFFVFLLQGLAWINATVVQKIILKDGSELDGYISMQRPGKNLVFTSSKALITIHSDKVKSIIDHEINENDLSKEWKAWADSNEAYIGTGENKSLVLSDIITETGSISKVRILAKGEKVKYLEMSPNSYSLNWDTISVVGVDKRSKTTLSGINRIYQLVSGMEYEGQYIEEVPGKTISICESNGITEVLDVNKIKKYSIKKINSNQSLYEQSELYDVILLNNNTSVRGIIIEQNYGANGNNGYLLIEAENSSIQSIKQKDIVEYRKELNPEYDPKDDILLVKGDIRINRKELKPAKVFTKYSRNSFIYDRENLISFDRRTSNNVITVEASLMDETQVKDLYMVKLHEDISKKYLQMDFFSDDVLFHNLKPDYSVTSVNKTTKIQYTGLQPGVYGFFDSQAKKIIPFIVK
jgi:hypothetical protein